MEAERRPAEAGEHRRGQRGRDGAQQPAVRAPARDDAEHARPQVARRLGEAAALAQLEASLSEEIRVEEQRIADAIASRLPPGGGRAQ